MEQVALANGEVQARYRISRSTVLRWTDAGRLPQPVNPSGKPKGRRYWIVIELEERERDWKSQPEGELQTASE